MSTLRDINGEALSVPGLRFWAEDKPMNRFRIVAQNDKGAVELWQGHVPDEVTLPGPFGGVEIHSPVALHSWEPDPDFYDCPILGGKCWTDGSSLTFSEGFHPLIQAGDSEGVLSMLAGWHVSKFEEVAA